MSIFIGHDQKTSIIRMNKIFPGLSRISDTAERYLEAGCDGTRSAPLELHFVPHCLQSAPSCPLKLRFGPKKLINSTNFVAGDNNTLALILISNETSAVDFFVNLILKPSIIQKKHVFFRIIKDVLFRLTEIDV